MSDCKHCESEATCLDEPMEDCKEFRETAEARRSRIEAEVKAHDERIRADARAEVLDKVLKEVAFEEKWLYDAIRADKGNYEYNIDMAFSGLKIVCES